jgi:hypothetical protein
MIEDKGLLNIVHRLVVDDDFRKRFATIPKETLMAELGISEEAYSSLTAIVPVLLAGGLFVLGNGPSSDPGTSGRLYPGYGHW